MMFKKIDKGIFINIIFSGVIIMALAAALFFGGSSINKHSRQILEKREELLVKAAELNTFAVLKSQYDSRVKSDLDILYNFVPPKDQLINFSRDMQFLAGQSGVGLVFSFVGETAPSAESLGTVKFNLNLTGEFDKLLKFIQLLERFRYLIILDSVSFNNQDSKTQMTVNGQVYFR